MQKVFHVQLYWLNQFTWYYIWAFGQFTWIIFINGVTGILVKRTRIVNLFITVIGNWIRVYIGLQVTFLPTEVLTVAVLCHHCTCFPAIISSYLHRRDWFRLAFFIYLKKIKYIQKWSRQCTSAEGLSSRATLSVHNWNYFRALHVLGLFSFWTRMSLMHA
jgi:hypothetical protein